MNSEDSSSSREVESAPAGLDKPDSEALFEALRELRSSCQSLMLATLGADGEPHCSYAPFVEDGDNLVIYISALALHTRDLLARPDVSVMLIADESSSKQIFARSRLTYQCQAEVVGKDEPEHTGLLEKLESRHGNTVALLASLPDFVMFRLVPDSGLLVLGFGNAHQWLREDPTSLRHVRRA